VNMRHATAVMIGPDDWYSSIGKETSDTSFRISALKRDDRITTVLAPSRYPEKIWSLLFPLSLTDTVFLNVDRIDRNLGETLIALDLAGMKKGRMNVADTVDRSMFASLVKGTVVEGYSDMDPDPATLREELLDIENGWPDGSTRIVIDQAFPVKGVGTVALGFVTSGTVRKHQDLFAFCSGQRTQVRSIQIHDRDHSEAPAGSRVGLALKNITPEDLPRGSLLSEEGSASSTDILDLSVRVSDYWKEPMEAGRRIHLWSSLQFVPAEVETAAVVKGSAGSGSTIRIRIRTESPIWTVDGQRFGLVHLDSGTFRYFAAGETI